MLLALLTVSSSYALAKCAAAAFSSDAVATAPCATPTAAAAACLNGRLLPATFVRDDDDDDDEKDSTDTFRFLGEAGVGGTEE